MIKRSNHCPGFLYFSYLILCISCIIFSPPLLAADMVIIANKNVPDDSLTKEDIKQIFLGKKKKWKDNSPITVVLAKTGEAHTELLTKYIDRTPSQFNNVWKRLVFTGEAIYPTSFSNDSKVIDFVSSRKGAIGYVISNHPPNNIKIIKTE